MSVDDVVNSLETEMGDNYGVDYLSLYQQLNTISNIASFIIGFLITLILILVPIVTILELCYINIAIFRSKLDDIIYSTSGFAHSALEFSFRDGVKAVKESELSGLDRSANFIYLRIKLKWIVLLAFMITITVSGTSQIISLMMKFIAGILEQFYKL